MKDVIKGRRYCHVVVHSANPEDSRKKWGGYMPSIVIEGESGHYPMQGGDHEWAVPWIWGKTFKKACESCDAYNKRRGLSEKDVNDIVYSSMDISNSQYLLSENM